jgi:DNA repair protein RecO (recombination protein O)
LIRSQFNLQSDYAAGVVMDYLAEVSEQLLPPGEPAERHFRLLLAMLDYLQERPSEGLWTVVAYFSLWAVRLAGFLPELRVSGETRAIAEEMFEKPIRQLTERQWSRETAADMRRFLIRQIEAHVERKLLTAPLLESI